MKVFDEMVQMCENDPVFHLYSKETRSWEYQRAWEGIAKMDPQPKTILDIGTGLSPWAAFLAKQGFEVTAQDVWPEKKDEGRCKAFRSEIASSIKAHERFANDTEGVCLSFTLKDLMDIEEKYDLVTAMSAFEHFSETWGGLQAYAKKIKTLAPYLIMTTDVFVPEIRPAGLWGHGWIFSMAMIEELFLDDNSEFKDASIERFWVDKKLKFPMEIIYLEIDNEKNRNSSDL